MNLPKIAFVRQKFSHFGGAELILNRTIQALLKRGVDVSLIAREWEPLKGLTLHRCDPARWSRASRDTRFANAACEIVATMRDALVQSHERIPCCDIYRAGDGVHAAFVVHRGRSVGFLKRLYLTFSSYHRNTLRVERKLFASPRLKAVIVNSEMVADEIVAHYAYPRERIHHIPNGIDLSRFDEATLNALRVKTRNDLGIHDARKVLVIVGSGYERKGVAQAIKALALSKSGAVLLVVGHEKRPSHYQSLASSLGIGADVKFVGRQKDVLPYLAAADAMILPTVYDPFPSATLEGFAAGLPVITSEACGARDIAREMDKGLVRDTNDITGLAQAISIALKLSDKPETRQRARAIAARFDMDKMTDGMLALYERVAKEKAG
jgi:UDP-glucose:(heptosyl)LPS alpha-1,3-glucosyltransferase